MKHLFYCPDDVWFTCEGKSYRVIPYGCIVGINFPKDPNDYLLSITKPSDIFYIRLYNRDVLKISVSDSKKIWGDKNPAKGQTSKTFKSVDRKRNAIYTEVFTDLLEEYNDYLEKVNS